VTPKSPKIPIFHPNFTGFFLSCPSQVCPGVPRCAQVRYLVQPLHQTLVVLLAALDHGARQVCPGNPKTPQNPHFSPKFHRVFFVPPAVPRCVQVYLVQPLHQPLVVLLAALDHGAHQVCPGNPKPPKSPFFTQISPGFFCPAPPRCAQVRYLVLLLDLPLPGVPRCAQVCPGVPRCAQVYLVEPFNEALVVLLAALDHGAHQVCPGNPKSPKIPIFHPNFTGFFLSCPSQVCPGVSRCAQVRYLVQPLDQALVVLLAALDHGARQVCPGNPKIPQNPHFSPKFHRVFFCPAPPRCAQ
ncbi:hypothetical protein DV515_00020055, partial [Chloebia gouldiae]